MDKYEVSIYNLKMLVNIIKINIRSTQFAKTLHTSTSQKIYRFEKIKKEAQNHLFEDTNVYLAERQDSRWYKEL